MVKYSLYQQKVAFVFAWEMTVRLSSLTLGQNGQAEITQKTLST